MAASDSMRDAREDDELEADTCERGGGVWLTALPRPAEAAAMLWAGAADDELLATEPAAEDAASHCCEDAAEANEAAGGAGAGAAGAEVEGEDEAASVDASSGAVGAAVGTGALAPSTEVIVG